jgi:hypothetical protein
MKFFWNKNQSEKKTADNRDMTVSKTIDVTADTDVSSEPDIPENFAELFVWNFQSCPNCGVKFEVLPTKDGTCDDCEEKYFARSIQPSKDRALFLPNELKEFNKHKATLGFRRRAIRFITNHNVASVDDFLQEEKHLLSDGQNWGSKDVVWVLLNKLKLELLRTGLLISASNVTWLQALWLYEETLEPKFLELLELHRKEKIEAIGQIDQKIRFSFESVSCCESCSSSDTFEGNSEEWLAIGVPQHSCSNIINRKREEGWCGCDFDVSWSVHNGLEIVRTREYETT